MLRWAAVPTTTVATVPARGATTGAGGSTTGSPVSCLTGTWVENAASMAGFLNSVTGIDVPFTLTGQFTWRFGDGQLGGSGEINGSNTDGMGIPSGSIQFRSQAQSNITYTVLSDSSIKLVPTASDGAPSMISISLTINGIAAGETLDAVRNVAVVEVACSSTRATLTVRPAGGRPGVRTLTRA